MNALFLKRYNFCNFCTDIFYCLLLIKKNEAGKGGSKAAVKLVIMTFHDIKSNYKQCNGAMCHSLITSKSAVVKEK